MRVEKGTFLGKKLVPRSISRSPTRGTFSSSCAASNRRCRDSCEKGAPGNDPHPWPEEGEWHEDHGSPEAEGGDLILEDGTQIGLLGIGVPVPDPDERLSYLEKGAKHHHDHDEFLGDRPRCVVDPHSTSKDAREHNDEESAREQGVSLAESGFGRFFSGELGKYLCSVRWGHCICFLIRWMGRSHGESRYSGTVAELARGGRRELVVRGVASEVFTLDLLETKHGQDRSDDEKDGDRNPDQTTVCRDEGRETHSHQDHDQTRLLLQDLTPAFVGRAVVVVEEDDPRHTELDADHEVLEEVHGETRDWPRSLVHVVDRTDETNDDVDGEHRTQSLETSL